MNATQRWQVVFFLSHLNGKSTVGADCSLCSWGSGLKGDVETRLCGSYWGVRGDLTGSGRRLRLRGLSRSVADPFQGLSHPLWLTHSHLSVPARRPAVHPPAFLRMSPRILLWLYAASITSSLLETINLTCNFFFIVCRERRLRGWCLRWRKD